MHTFCSVFLLFCLILLSGHSKSQTPDSAKVPEAKGISDTSDTFYMSLDQKATFPGGEEAWFRFLAVNMEYPAIAREKGIEGTVHVRFIIERDGSVSRVEVERTTARELNQAALDAVRRSPPWNPASNRGEAVRSIMVIPVTFRLDKIPN